MPGNRDKMKDKSKWIKIIITGSYRVKKVGKALVSGTFSSNKMHSSQKKEKKRKRVMMVQMYQCLKPQTSFYKQINERLLHAFE